MKKMKSGKQIVLVTGAVVTLLLSGCSSVPQEEIDSANAAIEAARSAGAEIYAAESFSALQDSMMVAMETIEAGKTKFIKSFGPGKEKLEQVTGLAGEVKAQSENRIAELSSQINLMLTEVTALLDENRQLLSEAPKGKEGTSALAAIKGEISLIEASVSEAGTMLNNGELLSSYDRVSAAKEKASTLKAELTEVIAKYKKAAGSR